MNSASKLAGVAALCLALQSSVALAQDAAPASDLPSLFGRVGASFALGLEHVRNDVASPTGLVPSTELNLPITDGFDYQLGYSYAHAAASNLKLSAHTLANDVTYYYRASRVTPYASAGFGFAWQRETVLGVGTRNNHLFYDLGAGVEVTVTKGTTVRVGVDHDESVKRPHARDWGYDVTASYWFDPDISASLGATLHDGFGGAHDLIVYTAGIHFAFD
jgi:hypothetical protein